MRIARRSMMAGSAAAALLSLARCGQRHAPASGPRLAERRAGATPLALSAREAPLALRRGAAPSPALLYDGGFAPLIRAQKNTPLVVDFTNRLRERHSTIHWHGLRIANAMDGVPYLTQKPVQPGETFRYAFTPPDAGTYFFHPHCETVEQMGRGLVGVLIVDGDAPERYDEDIVLVLKDWRVGEDGAFLPLLTFEGAGKAGTFGTLRTVNGVPSPHFTVQAGGNVRLRIINADVTRIPNLGFDGVTSFVVAREGNPVPPAPLETLKLGPAMRADVVLRAGAPGERFALIDYFAAEPVVLATFMAAGRHSRTDEFIPRPLHPNPHAEPRPDEAVRFAWTLSAASSAAPPPDVTLPGGQVLRYADNLCLAPHTFWSIGGKSWPERGHEALPPPLAEIARGRSVVITFSNVSQQTHPMHLHGHSFKVLTSNRAKIVPYWTDTVLLSPGERVDIAFVADNPGDWMVHCHIIEHQETGMMGWFRVA